MKVELDGGSLTIGRLAGVARDGASVSLAPAARKRIAASRAMLEEKIAAHEVMYGITTGIGEFSEHTLTPDELCDFQLFLVYSHAAGIGEPLPAAVVRGVMCAVSYPHLRAPQTEAASVCRLIL